MQHLFDDRTRLYAVFDGVMVTDLPKLLYKAQLPHYCLLTGDLAPDVLHAAPYLVFMPPGDKFTEFVLNEGFGGNWGIFLQSRSSMIEVRRHFRSLLAAFDEQGNPLTFRYYDPRVMRLFLPTCNGGELRTFFGPADVLFCEGDAGNALIKYQIENNGLKAAELN